MSRLSCAANMLRGPFRKLAKNLELTLRKPAIRRLGPVGRQIDARFHRKDTHTALVAAKEEARIVARANPKPLPTATSAAVDRTTGRVVALGHARDPVDVPPSLARKLPQESLEDWSVTNCEEVSAASQAIRAGSRLEDLAIQTVRTRSGDLYAPCNNCTSWLPEGI